MAFLTNFVDSFRRAEPADGTDSSPPSYGAFHADEKTNGPVKNGSDLEKAAGGSDSAHHEYEAAAPVGDTEAPVVVAENGIQLTTADSGLQRKLQSRHVQMIGLGGAIGTGLFIGSGSALVSGGPGFLLIDFAIISLGLAATILGLGELATALPIAGSFNSYATRFIDPAWGFAVGWNYWMQWLVTIPLEIVACSIVIQYWDTQQKITPGVWVTILLLILVVVNLFGIKGYGEFEFWASTIKVTAIIGFIIAAIVVNTGGAPSGQYIGATPWQNGLAFQNGFKGFSSVFVTAAFAFSGAEIIGLAAAETANPRKAIPKASKQIFWRVFIFFFLSLLVITFIVPCNDERLTGGSSDYDANASPFVIALVIGQIKILPSIINAVILISALSVGNASVYASSRSLAALAQSGQAPKMFAYIDREGRPLIATIACLSFGALAYIIYASSQTDVFYWLLSIAGLSTLFVWGSINLAHIRFRLAWKYQGKSVEELPWISPMGYWGSWIGLFINTFALILTFYKAAFPIGEGEMTPHDRAVYFFQSYLAFPIGVLFYVIGRFVVPGAGWVPISQIDVTTGRKDEVSLEELRQERLDAKNRPVWKKILGMFF
ncbi:unnamed protein product [Sympodiomycopsis kandeliae]